MRVTAILDGLKVRPRIFPEVRMLAGGVIRSPSSSIGVDRIGQTCVGPVIRVSLAGDEGVGLVCSSQYRPVMSRLCPAPPRFLALSLIIR